MQEKGHLHPITHAINDIVRIFNEMGFAVAEGPEVETEHYNFDALNVPPNHPARDMWDTFWLRGNQQFPISNFQFSKNPERLLLRTHTSPVQIRHMEKHAPPIRVIAPGKVFRYEATDATHEAQFYQIEGLMIGEDITLAHMKGILEVFFTKFFGKKASVRLRPSYFPFVEPGVEIDMTCFKCEGNGCSTCKGTGYIEIMGAGMVHPVVLNGVGIDSRKWQGFAFGGGIDRLAMLKYGIDDVRRLYEGDLRLIAQF